MGDKILNEQLNNSEYAVAGAASGSLTRFICQPLDVVKVRFQLQVEPLSKSSGESKYWNIRQAGGCIIKEEGLLALWKGHVPAQILSISYGLLQFSVFEILTQKARETLPHMNHHHPNRESVLYFLCGAVAGVSATIMTFPLDLMRTRLIAQGEPKYYTGLAHAITMVYTKEGPRGFYKGLSPTLIQIAPHTGAQFAFYEIFTRLWHKWAHDPDHDEYSSLHANSLAGSFVCGSLAGAGSKAFVYPFDLAKRRLQVQGFEQARRAFGEVFQCDGLIDCLKTTYHKEGFRGLFKGLYPSLLKAGLVTALNFTIYEQFGVELAELHKEITEISE